MKVVLVNPPRLAPTSVAKKIHPPLNLLYLASALKGENVPVEVIDACAEDMAIDAIVSEVAAANPSLVGFPVFSDILYQTNLLIRATRAALPATPIVLGGIHVTAAPRETAQAIPEADYLLTGYAEKTFPLLAKAVQGECGIESVPRLTWRNRGEIVTNPNGDADPEIDAIAFPDRSLVQRYYDRGGYYQLFNSLPFDSIVTGRGCPYRCAFCYNAIRRRPMIRSAENIEEEILTLYERGVRYIDVDDDNFTLDRDRAMKVFRWVQQERLKLKFFIKSRSDHIDRELLAEARRAGVRMVSFGIESGSQRILDAMNKGTTVEENAAAMAMVKDAGIDLHAGFVIGVPGETPETIEASIRFALQTRPTAISVQVLKPYPGTEVYEAAKANGTLVDSWDPNEDRLPWIRLPWTRTRADLTRQADAFNRRVYVRLGYLTLYAGRVLRHANIRLARYGAQTLRNLATNGKG